MYIIHTHLDGGLMTSNSKARLVASRFPDVEQIVVTARRQLQYTSACVRVCVCVRACVCVCVRAQAHLAGFLPLGDQRRPLKGGQLSSSTQN